MPGSGPEGEKQNYWPTGTKRFIVQFGSLTQICFLNRDD